MCSVLYDSDTANNVLFAVFYMTARLFHKNRQNFGDHLTCAWDYEYETTPYTRYNRSSALNCRDLASRGLLASAELPDKSQLTSSPMCFSHAKNRIVGRSMPS